MKEILKFVCLFLISYGLLIYISNFNGVRMIIHDFFKSSVSIAVKSALPDAYIDIQNYFDADHKIDPNIFYVVYGNPTIINAEKEFATKQGFKEYKISTFSFQLYIFIILIVPFSFLISLFLATPMRWQTKIKSLGISVIILLILIISKCILLTLFNIANLKIGIYTLSDFSLYLVYRATTMLTLGFIIIICFCLWLLFGFRNSLFSSQFNNFIKSSQK